MKSCIINIHVTPRGSRNEVIGWRDDILNVKITAPPVDGAANSVLSKFIADELGIKKSQVILLSGEKSRNKAFKILGLDIEDVKSLLS